MSGAMKHTPEPWALNAITAQHGFTNNDGGVNLVGPDGYGIVTVHYIGEAGSRKRYNAKSEERDANAARIVACVNACAGVDTADLRGPLADHGVMRLTTLAGHYQLQRDELAVALRMIANGEVAHPQTVVDVARAAIAKVK